MAIDPQETARTEVKPLKSFDILLPHAEHVSTLVNVTNRYPFTITLRQGRYSVDGKSLLGICSLERNKPITLEAYTNECDRLYDELKHMICS